MGNDQIGNINDRFFYLSNVNLNDAFGASFGRNDGVSTYYRPGVSISRYANDNITWELSRSFNLGMDLKMFNGLDITVDVYKQWRSQILQPKSSTESAYGFVVVPSSNYGKAETQGVDVAVNYQRSITKNLWANLRGTFTYATSKNILTDEIQYPSIVVYLSRTGHSITQTWGYIAERLFIDQKEVANSPVQFGDNGLLAGDIKYKDVNGDGVINNDDMVPIGYPAAARNYLWLWCFHGVQTFRFQFLFPGICPFFVLY